MNKKLIVASMSAVLLGGALVLPTAISAYTNPTDGTFAEQLSAKLGIPQTQVESAMSELRTERHASRQAEIETKIADAETAGTITTRQAELLNAIADVRAENFENSEKPERQDFSNLTSEERKAAMQELKNTKIAELVTTLNEKGLDTTQEEVEETLDSAIDADILPAKKGRMGGRMGGMSL